MLQDEGQEVLVEFKRRGELPPDLPDCIDELEEGRGGLLVFSLAALTGG